MADRSQNHASKIVGPGVQSSTHTYTHTYKAALTRPGGSPSCPLCWPRTRRNRIPTSGQRSRLGEEKPPQPVAAAAFDPPRQREQEMQPGGMIWVTPIRGKSHFLNQVSNFKFTPGISNFKFPQGISPRTSGQLQPPPLTNACTLRTPQVHTNPAHPTSDHRYLPLCVCSAASCAAAVTTSC